MNKNKKTLYLTQAAIIAALYAGLTYAQELLLPGTTSFAIQFRLSEALTMLCVFTPAAIPGVALGCLISNLKNISALPLDMIFGTAATLVSGIFMYLLRNVRIKGKPIFSALMPAIFNGVIIGFEIEFFFIEGSFHFESFLFQALCVAVGELAVVLSLGLIMTSALEKYTKKHNIF